jgi:O-acetyl-ADP-ribose deacetylase (regulator of RNase III)
MHFILKSLLLLSAIQAANPLLAVNSIESETFKVNGIINVHLTTHDITKMPVDVIVNAANKSLPWPAGGVCRVIYEAAGVEELKQWVQNNTSVDRHGNRLSLGKAIASPSFKLKKYGIKHIIHTAGPDARIGESTKEIYNAYKNSLQLADSLHARSIAFPAISIGIFACDKHEVAKYAIQAIKDSAPQIHIKDVYLTILDQEYYDICKKNLTR